MARNVRLGNLVLHIDGFHKLRTSPEVKAVIHKGAVLIAESATARGIECVTDPAPSRNRARENVIPADAENAVETARHPEIMLHAMNAARYVL